MTLPGQDNRQNQSISDDRGFQSDGWTVAIVDWNDAIDDPGVSGIWTGPGGNANHANTSAPPPASLHRPDRGRKPGSGPVGGFEHRAVGRCEVAWRAHVHLERFGHMDGISLRIVDAAVAKRCDHAG